LNEARFLQHHVKAVEEEKAPKHPSHGRASLAVAVLHNRMAPRVAWVVQDSNAPALIPRVPQVLSICPDICPKRHGRIASLALLRIQGAGFRCCFFDRGEGSGCWVWGCFFGEQKTIFLVPRVNAAVQACRCMLLFTLRAQYCLVTAGVPAGRGVAELILEGNIVPWLFAPSGECPPSPAI
jgi:hypothetical protein